MRVVLPRQQQQWRRLDRPQLRQQQRRRRQVAQRRRQDQM